MASKVSMGRSGLLMVAPYWLFFLLFVAWPMLFAFGLVFSRWDMVQPPRFIGVDNLVMLLGDPIFWKALWNTVRFLFVHITLQIVIALALGASCSFSSPVAYQTHLLVYGPGGYKFTDFVRVGIPLNIICAVIALTVIPYVWPF